MLSISRIWENVTKFRKWFWNMPCAVLLNLPCTCPTQPYLQLRQPETVLKRKMGFIFVGLYFIHSISSPHLLIPTQWGSKEWHLFNCFVKGKVLVRLHIDSSSFQKGHVLLASERLWLMCMVLHPCQCQSMLFMCPLPL